MNKGVKSLTKKKPQFLEAFLLRCGSRVLGKPATHGVTGSRNFIYPIGEYYLNYLKSIVHKKNGCVAFLRTIHAYSLHP